MSPHYHGSCEAASRSSQTSLSVNRQRDKLKQVLASGFKFISNIIECLYVWLSGSGLTVLDREGLFISINLTPCIKNGLTSLWQSGAGLKTRYFLALIDYHSNYFFTKHTDGHKTCAPAMHTHWHCVYCHKSTSLEQRVLYHKTQIYKHRLNIGNSLPVWDVS